MLFPEGHAMYRSWEGGKMTHQPTISQTDRNAQRKFNTYLGNCDFSVLPRSGLLSSVSGIYNCCCSPRIIAG